MGDKLTKEQQGQVDTANAQPAVMKRIADNVEAFKRIKARMQSGERVSTDDYNWYHDVLDIGKTQAAKSAADKEIAGLGQMKDWADGKTMAGEAASVNSGARVEGQAQTELDRMVNLQKMAEGFGGGAPKPPGRTTTPWADPGGAQDFGRRQTQIYGGPSPTQNAAAPNLDLQIGGQAISRNPLPASPPDPNQAPLADTVAPEDLAKILELLQQDKARAAAQNGTR